MSLISEALKEAQRERSGRGEVKTAAVLGDSFFPYPESSAARRAGMPLLLGAAGVIVILAGAYGVARFRARSAAPVPMSSIASQALITAPVSKPPAKQSAAAPKPGATQIQAPPAVVKSAAPEAKRSAPASRAVAAAPIKSATPGKPSVTVAQKPVDHPITPHAVAVEPAATQPSAALPSSKAAAPEQAPASPIQQQGGQSAVRVVVDPMGSADSLFRRAYSEQMRGNYDGAADLYEKAINTGKASADLYNNYGALLARRGNNTAAVEMYTLALKRDERNVNAWVNLAAAHEALGRHAEAMSDYAQAAKLDPMNGVVKSRLAKEYLAIGDTASARHNYEDALKIAPQEPDVHYAYAQFLESQRDRAGAIREYQEFINLAAAKYDASTVAQVKDYVAGLRGRPE